ncbi:arginase family protein [Rhodanobacter denitrificans]|uniref:arginase family protein n=1 Tax=Rhodanobacter TaxID=75309 RepID=UPI000260D4FA|nr:MULTISPECIES: arginase family protein [Rhodanobacter]EIM04315.1 hypothetical protein UUC_03805 [Rhodanobacter denitrificans]UJM89022.1 arginase family protein [Rhodanobacter denitrificans]
MTRPVVLDMDHSVGPLADRLVVPLEHWQETLRFGCSLAALRRFSQGLDEVLPSTCGTVMLGSGDFHHLSWPLIARVARTQRRFQVVVLDNHPDNMRYAFGVHCGSWVRRVALLPQVSHVHVLGISSTDIDRRHAWANYLSPLRQGRVSYWSVGVDVGWAQRAGLAHAMRGFDSADDLVATFGEQQRTAPQPTYLSIDKDVFAQDVARTNWDQGSLRLQHAVELIGSLRGGLVGSDITGEISAYRYRSWWKRRLSAMDAQPTIDERELARWQGQQHVLNEHLLAAIDRCPGASQKPGR